MNEALERTGWVDALLVLSGYLALLCIYDLGGHPYSFLAAVAFAFAALAFVHRRLRRRRLDLRTLLLVGAAARLLVLPLPPTLSDDVYRYLWDGQVTLAGHDAYALSPDAPALRGLRGPIWEQTAHRDVPTVYPPVALGLFSIAASLSPNVPPQGVLPMGVLAMKALVALIDLLGAVVLWRLAIKLSLPTERTIWYCWNPLVVLEGAGMAHIDLVGAPLAFAAVLWLVGDRQQQRGDPGGSPRWRLGFLAGLAGTLGVLVKLVPVLAMPMWLRQSRHRIVFSLTAVLLTVATLGPIALRFSGPPPGLVRYGVSWEFNGPLFEPLWRAVDRAQLVPTIKQQIDLAKDRRYARGDHAEAESLNRYYQYVYPQFLAKLVLGGLLLLWVAFSITQTDPLRGTLWIFGGTLLLSATVYPWYLAWTLGFAALRLSWPWLVLSATLPIAYLPGLLGAEHLPFFYGLVWVPFLLTGLIALARRARGGASTVGETLS